MIGIPIWSRRDHMRDLEVTDLQSVGVNSAEKVQVTDTTSKTGQQRTPMRNQSSSRAQAPAKYGPVKNPRYVISANC